MASLGSARHRGGLVLSVFVMQPDRLATLSLCPFSYGVSAIFPRWFVASPYCSTLSPSPAILFSVQIISNILSAIRDFPESYLNVHKSLMVYVKEGER